jgi:hypothetical protein
LEKSTEKIREKSMAHENGGTKPSRKKIQKKQKKFTAQNNQREGGIGYYGQGGSLRRNVDRAAPEPPFWA